MTDEPVALNEAPFLSLFLLSFWLGGVGDRALGQSVGGRNLHRIGLVAAVILDLHPQFMTGGGWTWCMRQVWYDHG